MTQKSSSNPPQSMQTDLFADDFGSHFGSDFDAAIADAIAIERAEQHNYQATPSTNANPAKANPATYDWLTEFYGVQKDTSLEDGEARFQGVHPYHSFIVQAPAGSGKTSLLSQRFLALLSQVEYPEQIVAMTFTKKAAAEMRERIITALQLGQQPFPADAKLIEQNTWRLAHKALQRDAEKGWNLIANANRLRIKTIDGINSFLVGQMPYLSKMGGQPQILQDAMPAYQEAVRQILKMPMLEEPVGRLLRLVNGRFQRAENLLISMLAKRDQWMRTLVQYQGTGEQAQEARDVLQAAMAEIVSGQLQQSYHAIYYLKDSFKEITQLADYAATNGQEQLKPLATANLTNDLTAIQGWRLLTDWILTQKGELRKSVTKNNGFPPGKGEAKENKERFLEALDNIRQAVANNSDVLPALVTLQNLPEPYYTDEQWQDLQWLIRLLTVSAAVLKTVFQQHGQADYIEIAQAASTALGSELEPTDLAQQLDYQIQHLLVDEFQDTSSEQYRLLTQLIQGWQTDEGRTLFLVGDPMQSIYRFREAEVGNFLKAWQGQIGPVSLQQLNLTINFRSTAGIVNWVNDAFAKVLPASNDIEKGAVSYSASTAFSQNSEKAVTPHWALNRTAEQEAVEIVDLIQARLSDYQVQSSENKVKKIAVLGRTRSSLATVAWQLKQQAIGFRAVELESLAERQEVHDVLALSRALLHLADREAWIALLRSPLVGLNLPDLTLLIGDMPYQTAWQAIKRYFNANSKTWSFTSADQAQSAFSNAGQARLQAAIPLLAEAIQRLGSLPFATLVKETWLRLDGPQSVENAMALENVEVFLLTLAEMDAENLNLQQLEQQMQTLYARPDSDEPSQQVELMTMHKSKGLEFDTVILPGLGRKPRADDNDLVSWFQFMSEAGNEELVIAPIDQKGQPTSLLRTLLKGFEKEKQNYEMGRLLYVAATRAKTQLHLFADINFKPKEKDIEAGVINIKPTTDSLLQTMWSLAEDDFLKLAQECIDSDLTDEVDSQEDDVCQPKVNRLPIERQGFEQLSKNIKLDFKNPFDSVADLAAEVREEVDEKVDKEADGTLSETALVFNQQNALLNTSVGNLVHAVLEQMVAEGIDDWVANMQANLAQRLPIYEQWLTQQGLAREQMTMALQRVEQSIRHALQNPKVIWALQTHHQASATEYPLTSIDEQGVANHIVDRTFIDEQGTRWIVDYKTSVSDATDNESFIAKQVEKYRPQLARYGQLFDKLESREQRWVLYFSYLDKWIEVEQCH